MIYMIAFTIYFGVGLWFIDDWAGDDLKHEPPKSSKDWVVILAVILMWPLVFYTEVIQKKD